MQTASIPYASKSSKNHFRIYSKSYNGSIANLRKTISRAARYRYERDGNVINLSKHSVTKKQFKVLNKNLNFCPTPEYYNKKEIKSDTKKIERKIKLKDFFELKNQEKLKENNSTFTYISSITPKSAWESQKITAPLTSSRKHLIDKLFKNKQALPRNNISQHEKNNISEVLKQEELQYY